MQKQNYFVFRTAKNNMQTEPHTHILSADESRRSSYERFFEQAERQRKKHEKPKTNQRDEDQKCLLEMKNARWRGLTAQETLVQSL